MPVGLIKRMYNVSSVLCQFHDGSMNEEVRHSCPVNGDCAVQGRNGLSQIDVERLGPFSYLAARISS